MGDWASLAMLPALGKLFSFTKEKTLEKRKSKRLKTAGDLSNLFFLLKKENIDEKKELIQDFKSQIPHFLFL